MNINEVHWNFSDNGTKEPAKSWIWNFYNFWTAWNILMRFSLLCSGEWALSFYMCVCIYIGVSLRPFEPKHDKTSKMICAPSEDSYQTGHPSSLTRVFAVRSVGGYKDPKFFMRTVMTGIRDWVDAQAYLSIHSVNRSFYWICHAAAHSSFTMERNVQVNCKVCPQYISYCKIPNFFWWFSSHFVV